MDNFRRHPVDYYRMAWPGERLWHKQEEILDSVAENQKTIVRAGHSVSKTHTVCRLPQWFLSVYKPAIVLATAPSHRQINSIFWARLRTAYAKSKFKLDADPHLSPLWRLADDHYAIGFSTDDADNVLGFHEANVLIILDEASGIHPKIWEAIESLMSSGNTKLVAVGNPYVPRGPFYESFVQGDGNPITISCYDAVKQNIPGLVTWDWIKKQEQKKALGLNPLFAPRVLGEFPDSAIDSVFPMPAIEWAMANTVLQEKYIDEIRVGAFDCAFGGADETVIYAMHGFKQVNFEALPKTDDPLLTAAEIIRFKIDNGLEYLVGGDDGADIGVIAGLRHQGHQVFTVKMNGKTEDEQYANLRAEVFFTAREYLVKQYCTLIQDPTLKTQLSVLTFFPTLSGKYGLVSKDDIRDDYGWSPDRADATSIGIWYVSKLAKSKKPGSPNQKREERYRQKRTSGSYMSA